MYRKTPDSQLAFEDFYLTFGGKLSGSNRWVPLARMIPWDLVEDLYATQFSQDPQGPSAKSARLALGALIIKERLGVSDEEADEHIRENPFLQYFLGFYEFRDEAPFDSFMYVHFRKRFSLGPLGQINEAIVQPEKAQGQKPSAPDDDDSDDTPSSTDKSGKLLIDASGKCSTLILGYVCEP